MNQSQDFSLLEFSTLAADLLEGVEEALLQFSSDLEDTIQFSPGDFWISMSFSNHICGEISPPSENLVKVSWSILYWGHIDLKLVVEVKGQEKLLSAIRLVEAVLKNWFGDKFQRDEIIFLPAEDQEVFIASAYVERDPLRSLRYDTL